MSDENIKTSVGNLTTGEEISLSTTKRTFMKKEQRRKVLSLNIENEKRTLQKAKTQKKEMSAKTVSDSLTVEIKANRNQWNKGSSSSPIQSVAKCDHTDYEVSTAFTQATHSSASPVVDYKSSLSADKSSSTKDVFDPTITDTTYSSGSATSKSEIHETPVKNKSKKKSVRNVASRYKTAAILAAKPTVSRENTPVLRENQKPHSSAKFSSTSGTTFNTTPTTFKQNGEHRYQQKTDKSNCITSTPTLDDSKVPILSYDASSIAADQSSFLPQCKSHLLKPSKITTKCKSTQPYTKRVQALGHPLLALPPQNSKESLSVKQSLNPESVTQAEVDILYVQYIQFIYLESRAAKSIQMRSHDAMEQLYKLWTVNQILMDQERSIDIDLETLRHLQHLQENLSIQGQYLQPVIKLIPKLDDRYNQISETVDTLLHHLTISGVSMSNGIQDSEGELSSYLEECENIVQTVYQTSIKQSKLTTVADLLSQLLSTIEAEIKEIDRCLYLISSSKKLVVAESSLKMEMIQLKENKL